MNSNLKEIMDFKSQPVKFIANDGERIEYSGSIDIKGNKIKLFYTLFDNSMSAEGIKLIYKLISSNQEMVTEVFNRIGEAEMHESSNSFGRFNKDNDSFEPVHKIESSSEKLIDTKKEFFESLEDDSLTIDMCNKLNHDWKNS